MSKAKREDNRRTVYVTIKDNSGKHWHSTDDPEECHNLPERTKPIKLYQIQDNYDGCAVCTDAEALPNNGNTADFKCAGCGKEDRLGVTGIRTLHPCHKCNDVTSWERINE